MKHLIVIIALILSSGTSQAEILFQDPTRKAIETAFNQLSEKEVKDVLPPNVSKKQYLLGLLYLNGDNEFHIERNCQKAVELLTKSWKADIADAGHALATMYYHGVCVEKNIDKARDLATETAQEGYILAQRMLGLAYVGEKWEELYSYDVEKGIYWLSKAGNAGDREAAGQLSLMYKKGVGVARDDNEYFNWLKKGAFNKFEKSNSLGFSGLARAYENGIGTEKDLVKAYKYYDLIGTAGVQGKQRISKKMTQDQIGEALRQSQDWQEENNVQVGGGWIQYK
ncbi:MAG: tetratricopeptide repeat protein [Pseudomonadota bacterium]